MLKKEKAVLLCRNNWNFICFSCNNCLLVVQQGCKYVILAPLHLKIHAIVFNGMNCRDDSLTCLSYCRQQLQRLLRSGSMRIIECSSSGYSLSVVGDFRKCLVAVTSSANDRDHLKRWLVSNDMACCGAAVYSICSTFTMSSAVGSFSSAIGERSFGDSSFSGCWMALSAEISSSGPRAQYWKRLTHDPLLWSW